MKTSRIMPLLALIFLSSCASYYRPVVNQEFIEQHPELRQYTATAYGQLRYKVKRPHYKTEFHKWILNMH